MARVGLHRSWRARPAGRTVTPEAAIMRQVLCRGVIVAAAVLCLLVPEAAVAAAGDPVGPGQHFVGLIDGRHTGAVVHTVCPGPSTPGRTGPVGSGQNLSVARVNTGDGFTGPFPQVYAWFVPNAAVNGALQVAFTTYRTRQAIPSGVRVPCDGTGRVEFSSCPYLAPCAYGWTPTYVTVEFRTTVG